jgi:hypothetical protein
VVSHRQREQLGPKHCGGRTAIDSSQTIIAASGPNRSHDNACLTIRGRHVEAAIDDIPLSSSSRMIGHFVIRHFPQFYFQDTDSGRWP